MTIEQAIEILNRNKCEGCRLENICTAKICEYKKAVELAIESLRKCGISNSKNKESKTILSCNSCSHNGTWTCITCECFEKYEKGGIRND